MKLNLIIFLLATNTAIAADSPSFVFDPAMMSIDPLGNVITFRDCHPVPVGTDLVLGARSVLLELSDSSTVASITFISEQAETSALSPRPVSITDIPTSDSRVPRDMILARLRCGPGFSPVYVGDELTFAGRHFARLEIFPVSVDSSGVLRLNRSVTIYLDGHPVAPEKLHPIDGLLQRPLQDRREISSQAEAPRYVIITSGALAAAFEKLARYRTETGFEAEIVLIEDIVGLYTGRDGAEKLREYLKDFYGSGGKYVLLGGDETMIPIRYAYDYRTDSLVSPENLQLCDLYFADVDGDWDRDSDGVWGEWYDDNADLTADLCVGRLPFSDTLEVTRYIRKVIAYELDPGRGERSYLTRAFFFSSDEMRDYGIGGQHGRVASAFPDWFVIDTIHGVELASGADPNPYNHSAGETIAVLSDGYGIVNVLAHGGSGGFTVRTASYNEWPKSFMVAESAAAENGDIRCLAPNDRTAFYYSLACATGGFDKDQSPFNETLPNITQVLLGLPDAGAVGFVAYSRWGWVGSSHLLQKAFFDTLFYRPDRPAVDAMNAVKTQYSYYRDLVLGQNYFGDPALRVYAQIPPRLSAAVEVDEAGPVVNVTASSLPVPGCDVFVTDGTGTSARYLTDAGGRARATLPQAIDDSCVITAVCAGYSSARLVYTADLATGIDDDDGSNEPSSFALYQNYPNPFNPATTIVFDLPNEGRLTVTIHNALGQVVSKIADGRFAAGRHSVIWDGCDRHGRPCASGVYFCRLTAPLFSDVRKMALVR